MCLQRQDSNPDRGKTFLRNVQTGTVSSPASYVMGNGGSFPGVKRLAGRGVKLTTHLRLATNLRMVWLYSFPPYVLMAKCLIN
jgi:hypothetical protein